MNSEHTALIERLIESGDVDEELAYACQQAERSLKEICDGLTSSLGRIEARKSQAYTELQNMMLFVGTLGRRISEMG